MYFKNISLNLLVAIAACADANNEPQTIAERRRLSAPVSQHKTIATKPKLVQQGGAPAVTQANETFVAAASSASLRGDHGGDDPPPPLISASDVDESETKILGAADLRGSKARPPASRDDGVDEASSATGVAAAAAARSTGEAEDAVKTDSDEPLAVAVGFGIGSDLDHYTYFGDGSCYDSSGNFYESVYYEACVTSLEACASKCAALDQVGQAGFVYMGKFEYCSCLYSTDHDLPSDTNGGSISSKGDGVGPVGNLNSCSECKCYKKKFWRAVEESCVDNVDCINNFCDGGTCSLFRVGDSCSIDDECASGHCYKDTCSLSQVGDSCSIDDECASGHCYKDTCECRFNRDCTGNPAGTVCDTSVMDGYIPCVPSHYWVVDGCKKNGSELGNVCAPTGAGAVDIAVRCCDDDGNMCFSEYGAASCLSGATYDEAESHCALMGQRLCTKDEMDSDICCGTGCDFNYWLVWTSTPCTP